MLDPHGAVLRTFGDVAAEAAGYVARWPAAGAARIAVVEMGNHPGWPAVLLALWELGWVVLPAPESGGLTGGVGLRIRVAGDGAEALVVDGPGAPVPDGADFIKWTSGTSGIARGVWFGAEALIADCDAVCLTMGIGEADASYGAIPFGHSYGFSNLVTPLLFRGVKAVVADDRLPRAVAAGLEATGATVFPGTPVMFRGWLGTEGIALADSVRTCISAGAPLPAALADAFRERFGRKVRSFYGSSECGGICYDAGEGAGLPDGYVGEAMRGVALEHLDDGRVSIRSAAVGGGYWPEEDAATLGGGRFIPADILEQCGAGWRVVGRVSDAINVDGRKVHPSEIERVLLECPGVVEAVVFGAADAVRGESVVACVAGDAGEEMLRRWAAERLPSWQVPRDWWAVESIPADARGKVSRVRLAEAYRARGR